MDEMYATGIGVAVMLNIVSFLIDLAGEEVAIIPAYGTALHYFLPAHVTRDYVSVWQWRNSSRRWIEVNRKCYLYVWRLYSLFLYKSLFPVRKCNV